MILCHIEAEPPIDFVTWTKNKRLFDPFETAGVMALKNGSLLIDKVKVHLIIYRKHLITGNIQMPGTKVTRL